MNVAHLLISQKAQRPDAPAIIEGCGSRQISFEQLEVRSGQCGQFLRNSGIGAGDHVLVFVPMSIDLYLILIAIFRIGAVATFLDPSAGAAHIDRCCAMVNPAAMIALSKAHLLRIKSRALRAVARKFSLGWPVPGAKRWEASRRISSSAPVISRSADDPALLTFTSGSTGAPKAAVRSHGFLAAQHASLQRAIDLSAGEIDLATLPIFSLANLACGVTTVIPDADLRRPGLIDPLPVLRQVSHLGVTRSVASPSFFERLLLAPDASRLLKSLRHVYTGGAPVFPGLMERLQHAIPAARIVAVYGSTEAEPIAHIAQDEISDADRQEMYRGKGLLAGAVVEDINLRIIANQWGRPIAPMTSNDFERGALPPNEPGEIVVNGAHVLRGYLNGQGDEQTKFRVDQQIWHRTGDAGYLDDCGRLWLLGRAEAKIDGENGAIYPFAVECAVSQVAAVARSAMILHQNKRMLVVQPATDAPSPLEIEIRKEVEWAGIEEIRCVRRLPLDKRHNAKIDYPALHKMLDARTT